MNKLIIFKNWKELQDAVNEIGWENFKLYNLWKRNHAWKRNGHLVMNMKDPRAGNDPIYLGYIYNDELAAIANVYLEHRELWIGDFEVSKFQAHQGIGRLFFNAIVDEYYDKAESIVLTYLDMNAKLFWERMGFVGNNQNKIMIYNMNKNLYESIMYKIAVQVKKAILEADDKLSDVETKWTPRKDLFKEKDPETIVRSLVRASKNYGQAMKRLTFYMNRAGSNLENEEVLNKAKKILHDKIQNEELDEGECCAMPDPVQGGFGGPAMPYNTPYNTIGVGNPVPPCPHHLGSGDIFGPIFPVYTKVGLTSSSKKRKKSKKRSHKK